MACELELMLTKLSPEEQERIKSKVDNLEVLFKSNVVYMKDKDEEWCDSIFKNKHINNLKTVEVIGEA